MLEWFGQELIHTHQLNDQSFCIMTIPFLMTIRASKLFDSFDKLRGVGLFVVFSVLNLHSQFVNNLGQVSACLLALSFDLIELNS